MNITYSIKKQIGRHTLAAAATLLATMSVQAAGGIVVDEYGQPVPSAQVLVKGADTRVLTDGDGKFEVDLKSNTTLLVVAPGYQATEFNVASLRRAKDKENVRIVLNEQYVPSSETVPGVYGPVDADSYIGSASTVYTDEINRTIGSTIIPGLTGKMAGLNIIQYRGARLRQTAANTKSDLIGWIPIMGNGIFSDNSEYTITSRGQAPIVYVDGIERDFYSIDPDAIETVSLQKDALSTMFNGMRSSRPVLLITTKNPRSQGTRVSFTGRFGYSTPIRTPKALSPANYAYLLNEALQNDGRPPLYSKDDFYTMMEGGNSALYPNVDWFGTAMRDHSTSQYYNVNVSGGNNFVQYFVNAGYYYENGLFGDHNDGYSTQLTSKRYSVDSKVDMKVTRDFTASISLLARLEEGNQPGGSGSGYSDLLLDIYRTPNNAYPVRNPNGTWGGNASFTNNLFAQVSESGYITDATRDLLGMLKLKYDFDRHVKGLSAYAMGSITVQSRSATFRTMRQPVYEYAISDTGDPVYRRYGDISTQTNSYRAVGNFQQLWGKIGVDYERRWGLHHFKAGLSGDTRQNINNYDLPALPSNILETVSYDYDSRYFVQASVAESYYNRYAPGRRWGTFYAAGLGWDMARESFMESASGWLDRLKLRAVYGRTGNGVDNSGYYTYYPTYSETANSGYLWDINSNYATATRPNSPLANPFISWEKADKWNIGVDAAFFNNRLTLQADYYNDKYFDLLQQRGKSIGLMGIAYPNENIGKQRRTGGEITLTWQDNIGAFNYFITGNWNIEKSKVLFMDEQNQPYDYLRHTGNAPGAYYGLIADGFFTSMEEIATSAVISGYDNIQPGDIKYRDLNGDHVIDEFDVTVIGNNKPLQYFGLDLGFEYKGFEFSTNWQGVYNRDIYVSDDNLRQGFQTYGQSYGQGYSLLVGRWTPETADTAILPRLSAGGNKYNKGGDWNSSFWVKNGNFIRCRNLYLGYTLPQTFCRNYLGGVRPKIFVNVQNLCTLSGYSWDDPEVSFTSYPLQRTWSVGLNLKF
ncbi:MAG: SusC/RagA family TonB-linked outer membrane protein [Muribaculaceae bacterium]|nr:SusC/RagA family TonB-linked outer membrane protein [Muribaculaceae bacterium]